MIRWIFALAAAVQLIGCSNSEETAKQVLEAKLAYKQGIEYRNMATFPRGVVCGEVAGDSPFGGRKRFRRFIVRNDAANQSPSDDDWFIFCSEDQAAALQSRLGIGPLGEQGENLQQIHADITQLQTALENYAAQKNLLPTTQQGLATLLSSDASPSEARDQLQVLPVDPWGRPYQYERSELGGIAHQYRIYTLGADDAAGGLGQDADVSSDHLKYLELINN